MNKYYYKNNDEKIYTINEQENVISESLISANVSNDDSISKSIPKITDNIVSGKRVSTTADSEQINYLHVIGKLKYYLLSIGLIQCITFTVNPSVIQSIKSEYSVLNHNDWMPLLLQFFSTVGDNIGRPYLPFRDTLSAKGLCLMGLFRIIFIVKPLFSLHPVV